MRIMAKFTVPVPVESGSRAVKGWSIGQLVQAAAERWKPEATCLGPSEERRTAFMVFDVRDPSDMVLFSEPWFQGANADVEIIPVMNGGNAQKGFARLGSRLIVGVR